MNRVKIFFWAIGLLVCVGKSQTIDSLFEVGTWQGFRQAAVSFTFDDNCPNQLSVVMPMFDKYNFKMTFFVVINWGPNWTALQAAALNGHEVASHTLSHSSFGTLTDEQQLAELSDSRDDINSHIQGQKCQTIAYPNCVLGNEDICKQYYIAARGCSGSIVSETPPDFMNINSIVCGSKGSIQRTADFTKKADAAAVSNDWVVFLIHAIDGESGYSPTSSEQLSAALDYLDDYKNKFWVSTFANVVRYIKERNSLSVMQTSVNDSIITFTVSDTLDNSIYDFPITVRRLLPSNWLSAKICQNNKTINSQIISVHSKHYIMFDVVPDSGDIQLIKESVTGVSDPPRYKAVNAILKQNYPNPFNPQTTIGYQIPVKSFVTLKVYDLLGREITTLVNRLLSAGEYSVNFNGSGLPNGIYFYQIKTVSYAETKKLVLLK